MTIRRVLTWIGIGVGATVLIIVGPPVVNKYVIAPIVARKVIGEFEDACYRRDSIAAAGMMAPGSYYAELFNDNPTRLFELFAKFEPGFEVYGTSYNFFGSDTSVVSVALSKRAVIDTDDGWKIHQFWFSDLVNC